MTVTRKEMESVREKMVNAGYTEALSLEGKIGSKLFEMGRPRTDVFSLFDEQNSSQHEKHMAKLATSIFHSVLWSVWNRSGSGIDRDTQDYEEDGFAEKTLDEICSPYISLITEFNEVARVWLKERSSMNGADLLRLVKDCMEVNNGEKCEVKIIVDGETADFIGINAEEDSDGKVVIYLEGTMKKD